MLETLIDKFRALPWLLLSLIALTLMTLTEPLQLVVLLWLLTKLFIGVYLGYWIDRSLFPYARPGKFSFSRADGLSALALLMLRRAIIVAAVVLALALGV